MVYKEECRDLFSVSDDYYFAQCIGADFKMGKGIAVEFNNRFNTKGLLILNNPAYLSEYIDNEYAGDCILQDKVLNLITKRYYYNKPTYVSMREALVKMKSICLEHGIKKVAMPTIGCGLDRLSWLNVSVIVQRVFADTDIEILVCKV